MASGVRRPDGATAALALSDGTVLWGRGVGAEGSAVGEVCFNTSLTGYQEILTDPSYAGQIVTFTFPHIGNVGANGEDIETLGPAARGLVLRMGITNPSNFRATRHLDDWLRARGLVGIAGVDTRRLTRRIRAGGAPNGVVVHAADGAVDAAEACARAAAWPGLEGMDLATEVSCRRIRRWEETRWELGRGYGRLGTPERHIVAVDYGAKRNILRCLADLGSAVTVVPADTASGAVLALEPDGIFLANGPGDPAATGAYAVGTVRALIDSGKPIFGICLGHQILALALGARTGKMAIGHRGANHPVQDLESGRVEITSQNHGFAVLRESLPPGTVETHRSLFDGSLEGLRVEGRPIFSVQYHPEASPGPRDAHHLFRRFTDMVDAHAQA